MVTTNRLSPYQDYPDSALGEDILAEVVYWRARGLSWEDTAAKIQWIPEELRRAVRHDPHFKPALALATREYLQESEAQALGKLRELMNDQQKTLAKSAARCVLNFVTQQNENRTRITIERIRAEAQLARTQAKATPTLTAKQQKEQAQQAAESQAEAEHRQRMVAGLREAQEASAVCWAREHLAVYLWGGCHKLGEWPDATDTPLYLLADRLADGRMVYWALTNPMPVPDPDKGPFLEPPGCQPRTYPHTTGGRPVLITPE